MRGLHGWVLLGLGLGMETSALSEPDAGPCEGSDAGPCRVAVEPAENDAPVEPEAGAADARHLLGRRLPAVRRGAAASPCRLYRRMRAVAFAVQTPTALLGIAASRWS